MVSVGGGCTGPDHDRLELGLCPNETTTLLLVGRTGNGKSATGNSILGRTAFKSRSSSSGVTATSELQTAAHAFLGGAGAHTIRVIDTPGLGEVLEGSDSVVGEIARCADLARDGIHGILVVLTTRARFSVEELAAIGILRDLFGEKMVDYMIVVFTGGDDLEANDESLEDYLGQNCPHALKELLAMCQNRQILFDNRTKDQGKMYEQVEELLFLVNEVISLNGGKPYKDQMFQALKRNAMVLNDNQQVGSSLSSHQISELKKKLEDSYEQQLKRITETIESKMKEATAELEKRLTEERKARAEAQEAAKLAAEKSLEDINRVREDLRRAQDETNDLRNRINNKCAIM